MAAMTYPIGDNLFVWTLLAPVSRLEEVGLTPRTRARGPQYASGSHQLGKDKQATGKCSSHVAESLHQAEELSVKEVACSYDQACLLSSARGGDRLAECM